MSQTAQQLVALHKAYGDTFLAEAKARALLSIPAATVSDEAWNALFIDISAQDIRKLKETLKGILRLQAGVGAKSRFNARWRMRSAFLQKQCTLRAWLFVIGFWSCNATADCFVRFACDIRINVDLGFEWDIEIVAILIRVQRCWCSFSKITWRSCSAAAVCLSVTVACLNAASYYLFAVPEVQG